MRARLERIVSAASDTSRCVYCETIPVHFFLRVKRCLLWSKLIRRFQPGVPERPVFVFRVNLCKLNLTNVSTKEKGTGA